MKPIIKDRNALHPNIEALANDAKKGTLARREFLALASTLGASSAIAYGMLGLSVPSTAQADTPSKGGVLRVAMSVMDIADPRKFDWPEKGNSARQFLEGLVSWNHDFTFSGILLESWQVSDDTKTYTLNLRPGVTWTNGDAFTSDHVVYNVERWCDSTVEGNAMATRLGALVDPESGKARVGAIEKVDDHTVRLHLNAADITLIATFADYTALLSHPDSAAVGSIVDAPIGTGAFELVSYTIGEKAVYKRRESGTWWGGEAHLDGIEMLDYGTDPSAMIAAFDADEIDVNIGTNAEFAEVAENIGLVPSHQVTASTVVLRMNVNQPPFTDQRVRQAMQASVDNAVLLELGFGGNGQLGDNFHVGPMHPEYPVLPVQERNIEKAQTLMAEAGQLETEIEIISLDEDWLRWTADAAAAQIRDAGFNVTRTLMPGSTFWNGWTSYAFSTTSWGARPLGVQIYSLAYRSDVAWNETGHANPEFDAKLDEALATFDTDARRIIMTDMATMLRDSGVIIQPFWRNIVWHKRANIQNYNAHQAIELHLNDVWIDG
ncbi:ABC transporter substrate-binding protein [Cochlodiniinecator piscidefendens]|uniref:ABC transporter substrate-binding protein n=1 Tax=Cochlodiniinecator piscidefendens TaxID=2715756 RepID=UPI00197C583B|nr:ABC transporter substrate-binding protein [Cochlodiniinecator piscidefendens]